MKEKRDHKPTSAADLLKSLEGQGDLGLLFAQARVWERWPEVVGERLSAHGRPRGLREGTLFIEAESPVWMHRFTFQRFDIVRRINRLVGRKLVAEIFVTLSTEDLEGGQDRENTT